MVLAETTMMMLKKPKSEKGKEAPDSHEGLLSYSPQSRGHWGEIFHFGEKDERHRNYPYASANGSKGKQRSFKPRGRRINACLGVGLLANR